MILTDGTHLVSDTDLDELHRFASLIGLKRCWLHGNRWRWFYGSRQRHPHYDLTTARMARKAERVGATRVPRRVLVRRMVRE